MTTIPDFERLVLDRLEICNGEIKQAGDAQRVYRLPPTFALDVGECPAITAWPGTMLKPIPSTAQHQVEVQRNYAVDVIALPLPSTTDTASKGADALTKASLLFAKLRNYYMNHRRLETDGTTQAQVPALQWMIYDLLFIEGGLAQIRPPGGVEHVGFICTLTITMMAALR